MSRTVQIILCLAMITGIRGNGTPIACRIATTPSPKTCPAVYTTTTTTTTTPAPFVCPYRTTTTTTTTTPPPSVCPYLISTITPAPTTSSTTSKPPPSTLTARNPDPNPSSNPAEAKPTEEKPTEAKPNFIMVPGYPGMPNMPMPWSPYPMFNSYMPIVEDPTTGQRYYVMPNPNRRTNKYTQTFNIYSPDLNPGFIIPSTVAPNNVDTTTSTEKPALKS